MAEINTGLGWAANSDWLLAGTGQLATLSGAAGFPNQPIQYLGSDPSPTEVLNGGLYIGKYRTLSNREVDGYISTVLNNHPFMCLVGTDIYYFSPVPEGTNYGIHSVYFRNGVLFTQGTASGTNLSTTSNNFYYIRYDVGYTFISSPLPVYSSVESAAADLQIISDIFEKTNAGYAVACIAKWKTQADATIETPVLISSVTEYTDMTESDGSYNLAKLNILRDGMRFYMSFFDVANASALASTLPVLDLSGPDEPPRTLETVFAYIADLDHAAILVLNSPDPYEQETGGSEEEGGDGEDLEDDPVEEETLPLPSVAGHGFCTIYVPSSQELGQMSSYLWGGGFDVSQVIKLFSNPMDSILGLSAVPVSLTGSPEQIYLGGVALKGITMPKYTGRTSVKVDFGSVTVAERWGSYLDYAPYTEFSIYLPFIGIKPLKADDIMGKTISLMYAIDILSGGCVAYLRPAGGSVLYEWSGQCALQIPVTGRSYDNVFQSAMRVATTAVAAVAAPASAPVLSGAVASAAVQAAATKPHIERSGTVNGITGFLGQLRPYLIRTIPEAYIPADQNKFIGYPAYINVDLATVKGYNEVDSIHLENVTATGAELEEIESILKGGVIF